VVFGGPMGHQGSLSHPAGRTRRMAFFYFDSDRADFQLKVMGEEPRLTERNSNGGFASIVLRELAFRPLRFQRITGAKCRAW